MALVGGSVFPKTRGTLGGMVFGAARTRQGKETTIRILVPPSNPNTVLQQEQRSIFSDCQSIVRRLGTSIYQTDFNRSVGQLPGFQSMQSIFMQQTSSALLLQLVNEINLGTLHVPATLSWSIVAADHIDFTWSVENGSNGTANDLFCCFAVASTHANRIDPLGILVGVPTVRSAGTYSLVGFVGSGEEYNFYCYFRGAGLAAGNLSVATPGIVTIT